MSGDSCRGASLTGIIFKWWLPCLDSKHQRRNQRVCYITPEPTSFLPIYCCRSEQTEKRAATHTFSFHVTVPRTCKVCIPQKEWCILPLNCMSFYVTHNYKSYEAKCPCFLLSVCIKLVSSTALVHVQAVRWMGPRDKAQSFRAVSGALVWVEGQASPFPLCSWAVWVCSRDAGLGFDGLPGDTAQQPRPLPDFVISGNKWTSPQSTGCSCIFLFLSGRWEVKRWFYWNQRQNLV